MDFLDTIRSTMPVYTIVPSKNISHIRGRKNIFHDKFNSMTKFNQYLSTNPVLQKVYQENFNLKRLTTPKTM